MHQLTPERQFATLLAAEPSRPFVTYYDEATGERSELSAKSLANWVAKTHHLLADELGLGVGDTALVALPAHWISVPVLLGCLTAGLALATEGPADVAFAGPGAAGSDVADAYAIAPDSAAVGFRGAPPDGFLDYVAAVRPQEDTWPSVHMPAGPDDPCLPDLTRREVATRAAETGLPPGARLLTTRPWQAPTDWIDAVLAPIAMRGSLVIVANAGEDVVARRMTQELATARLA